MKQISDLLGFKHTVLPCSGGCGKDVEVISLFENSPRPACCPECQMQIDLDEKKKEEEARIKAKGKRLAYIRDNYLNLAPSMGIPKLYLGASFERIVIDNDNREPVDSAKKFDRGIMMLYGASGRGKTVIASCIAREWILQDKQLLFITAIDLFNRIREAYGKDNDAIKISNTIREYPLLIIDDLGSEKVTDLVLETVYGIIDYRHTAILPTVITTNMKPQAFSKQYGVRVMSRIEFWGQVIEVKGNDRRKRGG